MNTARSAPTKVANKAVGPVGYGLMSLTMPFDPITHEVAAGIMKAALDQGANFWNGGMFYGTPTANSLHLLCYYFKKYPGDAEKVVLCLKGAFNHQVGPTGGPKGIRDSVDEALRVLEGTKKIDVFEIARVDPNVPIEESVQTLAELIREGKIGGVGLSEVSANTTRRANAVHPLSMVEIELSLFTPDPLKNGILDTCHELSIPIVAYSPVGRGWLTGKFRTTDDLPKDAFRSQLSRLKHENFDQNFKLFQAVEQISKRRGLQTSQVAIAWVARQGTIPIPGSSKIDRVVLNSNLADLEDDDMEELEKAMEQFPVAGERYGGAHEKLLNA